PGQPLNRATLNQMQRSGQPRPFYRQVQARPAAPNVSGPPAQNPTQPVPFNRSNRAQEVQTPANPGAAPVPFDRRNRPRDVPAQPGNAAPAPAPVSPPQNPDAFPRRVERPD